MFYLPLNALKRVAFKAACWQYELREPAAGGRYWDRKIDTGWLVLGRWGLHIETLGWCWGLGFRTLGL